MSHSQVCGGNTGVKSQGHGHGHDGVSDAAGAGAAGGAGAGGTMSAKDVADIKSMLEKLIAAVGKMKSDVPPMGRDGVLAKEKELLPKNRGELKGKLDEIDKIIADPKTAPDLRDALKAMRTVLTGGTPKLNATQVKDLAVLKAHPEVFPVTTKNIQEKIDDPSTPADVKKALTNLKNDPTFSMALDTGKHGGGIGKADGRITFGDVKGLDEDQANLAA